MSNGTADRGKTPDPSRDLAQWLLEAGRRRPARQLDPGLELSGAQSSRAPAARPPLLRQTVLLSALVAAYLQYFYLNVMVQIGALPTLVIYASLN